MRNEVKIYQIALLLLLIVPGGKYLTMPALLAGYVGKNSWVLVAIMLAIDGIGLSMVLWALKANKKGLSFKEVLTNTLSPVGAIIVYVVIIAMFAVKCSILFLSGYRLFASTFSVKTSWLGFIIPIVILSVFVVSRGFQTVARLGEFFAVVTSVAITAILLGAMQSAEWGNLMPIMDDANNFFVSMTKSTVWFNDYLFILFLLDSTKIQKRVFAPILLCFAIASILVVYTNALFVSLFGELAKFSDLAMSKISQFSLTASKQGRLDWLSLSLWTVTIFVKGMVYLFCVYKSAESIFGLSPIKFRWPLAVVISLPIVVAPLFLAVDEMIVWVMEGWAKYPLYLVQYLLPLVSPLLVFLANKKERAYAQG